MKLALLFFLSCLFFYQLKAQDNLSFAVKNIADSLRNEASSVYRKDETTIDVSSISEYKLTSHQAYTIFSEKALKYFQYVHLFSDKFHKLDDAEVKIYDSTGVELKKYKQRDFRIVGSPLNDALVSDNKNYLLEILPKQYPCTIEVTFTINFNGYIDFPDWKAASFYGALENSSYRINIPQKLGLRYKSYNTSIKPTITTNGEFTNYEWKTSNVKEVNEESGSFSWWAYFPMVAIAPNEFKYDDRKGSFETWKTYGSWNFEFYNEKEPFGIADVDNIKASVAALTTPAEKISYLYKKMQQETRYVSIQLGIGGLKPFPAKFIHEKKYGDCKALSNYMKQQLQVIGIKSYAAIIKSGANSYPADPDFPNEGFDHVILCVPLEKDTMWLECTSQQTPPGVLGTFTENRNALLVTENGGVLVNTPASKKNSNQWIAKTNTEVFDDGSAVVRSRIFVSGEIWETIFAYTNSKSKDDIKKALVSIFGYKAPDDFEFKQIADSSTGHILSIDLAYNKLFDFKAGSKHFFPFRHYKLNDETIEPSEKRKHAYLFDFPYIKVDSTTYKLPATFKSENLPASKEIKTDFVFYKNELSWNQQLSELMVITKLTINKHIVPASSFNEVALSFMAIKKDEAQKIVLKME